MSEILTRSSDATALAVQRASDGASVSASHRRTKRRPAHTSLDGRTWEYRLLQKTRVDLTKHCGGSPSPVQLALIERAAHLTLHLAKQDALTSAGDMMSEHATRQYLAWSNTLSKTLRHLGLKAAPAPVMSLTERLAAMARQSASAP